MTQHTRGHVMGLYDTGATRVAQPTKFVHVKASLIFSFGSQTSQGLGLLFFTYKTMDSNDTIDIPRFQNLHRHPSIAEPSTHTIP